MEWIEIDKNNLPKGEVLAADFTNKYFGYTNKIIGYLHISDGFIHCENDNEILNCVTHYIDINNFDL